MTRSHLLRGVLVVLLVLTLHASARLTAQTSAPHWVTTWTNALVAQPVAPAAGPAAAPTATATTTAPAPAAAAAPQAAGQAPAAGRGGQGGAQAGRGGGGAGGGRGRLSLNNQTLRQNVHLSIGGDRLRVVLTNAFGTAPIVVDAAFAGLAVKGGGIAPGGKPLTFSGRPTVTIPAGAVIISDAVDLKVPAAADLAIDIHLPGDVTGGTSPLTMHASGLETNYISTPGNMVGKNELVTGATTMQSVYFLSRVEVGASPQAVGIATFGDSITDGTRSTPDMNRRWPDVLARRLEKQSPGRYAVMNAAIAGNRLLAEANGSFGINALARFDRDVIVQPGLAYVIVMEGINDIGMAPAGQSPTPADLILAHQQLIERAHQHGLKIYASTLTPYEGAAYYTPAGEVTRKAVNEWLRTSKAYDGLIDFDAVIRDPASPTKFLPAYDSGDHLHPNDAGYEAMGNAVDLKLFTAKKP